MGRHHRTNNLAMALCALFIIAGCSSAGGQLGAGTPLWLQEPVLQANKFDVQGLYMAWIAPFSIRRPDGGWAIPHETLRDRQNSEAAIVNGFTRFCVENDGFVEGEEIRFGRKMICKSNGSFIGSFELSRYQNNLLEVVFESPKQLAARLERLRIQEERKLSNGPTGWIVTDEGREPFLRLGTLKQRDVVVIETNASPMSLEYIESVKAIQFRGFDIDVELLNGKKFALKNTKLRKFLDENTSSTYGVFGFPVVLIDKLSKEPYTRLFPNFVGIKSIEIASYGGVDVRAKAGEISTNIQLSSEARRALYKDKISRDANALYLEANAKGWINLLPDRKNIPHELAEYLESELRSTPNGLGCKGDPVAGVYNLDDVFWCENAKKELGLMKKGYAIVPELMPMSTKIIFNKLKSDAMR